MTLHPVILSGGVGSRLWPMSRQTRPKQLAKLAGTETMVQATARRAMQIPAAEPPILVCGAAHVDEAERQLAALGMAPSLSIVEPMGRNTAPAIAAVALSVEPDDLLLVLPADQVITDIEAFVEAVAAAEAPATEGMLVTFGVTPDGPATGYGYIEHGPRITDRGTAASVVRFVEKPDLDTAQQYLASGNFSWNAGMFLMRARTFLTALGKHQPAMTAAVQAALDAGSRSGSRIQLDAASFAACPADSIDYAVMEKTDRAAVVPLDAGWSDVGSWSALWQLADRDPANNAVSGAAYVESVTNSLVRADERPVAVIGLDNVVVVDTGDAVLVTSMDHAQDVKKIVERLQADGRSEV